MKKTYTTPTCRIHKPSAFLVTHKKNHTHEVIPLTGGKCARDVPQFRDENQIISLLNPEDVEELEEYAQKVFADRLRNFAKGGKKDGESNDINFPETFESIPEIAVDEYEATRKSITQCLQNEVLSPDADFSNGLYKLLDGSESTEEITKVLREIALGIHVKAIIRPVELTESDEDAKRYHPESLDYGEVDIQLYRIDTAFEQNLNLLQSLTRRNRAARGPKMLNPFGQEPIEGIMGKPYDINIPEAEIDQQLDTAITNGDFAEVRRLLHIEGYGIPPYENNDLALPAGWDGPLPIPHETILKGDEHLDALESDDDDIQLSEEDLQREFENAQRIKEKLSSVEFNVKRTYYLERLLRTKDVIYLRTFLQGCGHSIPIPFDSEGKLIMP